MPRQEQPFAFALSLATLPAWRTEGRSCFSFSILLCVWTWISIGPLRILILGVKKTAKLGFTSPDTRPDVCQDKRWAHTTLKSDDSRHPCSARG